MMKFHSVVIYVKKIEVAKRFYADVLNLAIDLDYDKCVTFKTGISLWELQPKHVVFPKTDNYGKSEKSTNKFELYLETDDITKVYQNLNQYKVEFLHGILEESWGQRTVRFYDPDKNLIEIGESMPAYVGRMFKNGLTTVEISKKSSLPIEIVDEIVGS